MASSGRAPHNRPSDVWRSSASGRISASLLAALLLAALATAYWQVRVIGAAHSPRPSMYSLDLYTQHLPMVRYGFDALRRGELPLWNPYQLCGTPFLPIPYTGVFYPPNALYLFLDTAIATDVSGWLHGILAMLGTWLLLRELGASHLAGIAAAATFAWSGWLAFNVNQPSLWAGLSWMPWTVLATERVLRGRRFAWLLLTAVVALQLLGGAIEILLHALLAAAIAAVPRLRELARTGGLRLTLARVGMVVAAGATAALLAAAQLLPTVELLAQSARAPGAVTAEVALLGHLEPADFLPGIWGQGGHAKIAAGLLPLVLAALAFRDRRALPFLLCAGLGALLASGGEAYRLWHAVPFVGSAFQRPYKFLDLWALGLAVVCGLGLEQLLDLAPTPRRQLWRRPAWLAALAVAALLLLAAPTPAWRAAPLLVLAAALLPLYGIAAQARTRRVLVATLAAAQIAGVFFSTGNRDLRPSQQPAFYDAYPVLRRFLAGLTPPERVYLFPSRGSPADLINKAGMMQGFDAMTDYDAMIASRYAAYFDHLSDYTRGYDPAGFQGSFLLGPRARMKLMDLTGTRTYVAFRGQAGDDWLAAQAEAAAFRPLFETPAFRAYERPSALPRAWLVRHARVVPWPRRALEALAADAFDPRAEVILEQAPPAGRGQAGPARGSATIVAYEPTRVRIDVDSRTPAFLVLSDLYYAGWKAYRGEVELPVLRANYLFRAVQIPAGKGEVRFEYRPASVRFGLAISAAALLAVCAAAIARARG